MTRLDAALIFEALSTGCPCVASFLSIHNMVAWVVDRFGSPDLQKRYLPRALQHGARRELLPDRARRRLRRGGAHDARAARRRDYVLDGVKQFISGAGASDVYLVMARTGEGGPRGVSAFMVDKGRRA